MLELARLRRSFPRSLSVRSSRSGNNGSVGGVLPLAHAFLATAIEHDAEPAPDGLIELTVNEFRRLFHALLLTGRHSLTTLLA